MRFKRFLREYSRMPDGIRDHMESLGYTFLGSGVDQAAYMSKSGEIIKIFGASKNGNKQSKAHVLFERWAEYCKKNSANPFLPIFHDWEYFEFDEQDFIQIKMERLQALPNPLQDLLENIANFANVDNMNEFILNIKKGIGGDDLVVSTGFGRFRVYDSQMTELNKLALHLSEEHFDLLFHTLQEIYKLSEQYDYDYDLHGENFMHRNDGTPIIVDPWSVDTKYEI